MQREKKGTPGWAMQKGKRKAPQDGQCKKEKKGTPGWAMQREERKKRREKKKRSKERTQRKASAALQRGTQRGTPGRGKAKSQSQKEESNAKKSKSGTASRRAGGAKLWQALRKDRGSTRARRARMGARAQGTCCAQGQWQSKNKGGDEQPRSDAHGTNPRKGAWAGVVSGLGISQQVESGAPGATLPPIPNRREPPASLLHSPSQLAATQKQKQRQTERRGAIKPRPLSQKRGRLPEGAAPTSAKVLPSERAMAWPACSTCSRRVKKYRHLQLLSHCPPAPATPGPAAAHIAVAPPYRRPCKRASKAGKRLFKRARSRTVA